MKTLQNNFTTPEQSKRLLELGVPADSADCYYNTLAEKPYVLSDLYSKTNFLEPQPPCWTVGRLMEIYDICVINSTGNWADYTTRLNYVNYLVSCFETSNFDFSKLEE